MFVCCACRVCACGLHPGCFGRTQHAVYCGGRFVVRIMLDIAPFQLHNRQCQVLEVCGSAQLLTEIEVHILVHPPQMHADAEMHTLAYTLYR